MIIITGFEFKQYRDTLHDTQYITFDDCDDILVNGVGRFDDDRDGDFNDTDEIKIINAMVDDSNYGSIPTVSLEDGIIAWRSSLNTIKMVIEIPKNSEANIIMLLQNESCCIVAR